MKKHQPLWYFVFGNITPTLIGYKTKKSLLEDIKDFDSFYKDIMDFTGLILDEVKELYPIEKGFGLVKF